MVVFEILVIRHCRVHCSYEGGSESSVIGVTTLLIDMIGCFIIWQVMKYREICIKYNQYLKKLYFHM